jgi:TusA-related sulfurtransferase
MAVREIDARGMQCPGPIVEVFKAMNALQQGDEVNVQVTDRGFVEDVKAWCRKTGNSLVSLEDDACVIRARIKKAR